MQHSRKKYFEILYLSIGDKLIMLENMSEQYAEWH